MDSRAAGFGFGELAANCRARSYKPGITFMNGDDIRQQDTERGVSSAQATASHTCIAECAYYLWMAQGCPEGRSDAIWLEAEALVRARAAEAADEQELQSRERGSRKSQRRPLLTRTASTPKRRQA
jgi:hypothetical protein